MSLPVTPCLLLIATAVAVATGQGPAEVAGDGAEPNEIEARFLGLTTGNFDVLRYKENLLHNKISFLFSLIPRPNYFGPPGAFNQLGVNMGAPYPYPAAPIAAANPTLSAGTGFNPLYGNRPIFNPTMPVLAGANPALPAAAGFNPLNANRPAYPSMSAFGTGFGYPGVGYNPLYQPGMLPVVAEQDRPQVQASTAVGSSGSGHKPAATATTTTTTEAPAGASESEEDSKRGNTIKMSAKSFNLI